MFNVLFTLTAPPDPWIAAMFVLTLLGGMIGGLYGLARRTGLPGEATRKLLHMGMGAAMLALPALFATALPVVLLAFVATAVLAALRWVPALRRSLGQVMHGVDRDSYGELCYPAAVAALFVLSGGEPVLYVAPLLLLALADAAAALVGRTYGLWRYAAPDGEKTFEGSLAFWVVAVSSTYLAVLLLTPAAPATALLLALLVGSLTMLLEAVSWKGLDNLFVPLGGLFLLKAGLAMDPTALAVRLAAAVVLLMCVTAYQHRADLRPVTSAE